MQLTKTDLKAYKELVQEGGRLSPSLMSIYLIGIFIYSALSIGIAYAAANANTVGWHSLERGWQIVFYVQVVLFIFHFISILISFTKANVFRKLTSIAMVLFTYKTVLDQYIAMFMFFKDKGVYDQYAPYTFFIIICGFIFHLFVLRGWIRKESNTHGRFLKKTKNEGRYRSLSLIFILGTLVTIILRNGFWASLELLMGLTIFTVVYILLLIGVCEFIVVAYLMFKYPEILETKQPKSKMRRKKKA